MKMLGIPESEVRAQLLAFEGLSCRKKWFSRERNDVALTYRFSQ
jgi:hypothetical protein